MPTPYDEWLATTPEDEEDAENERSLREQAREYREEIEWYAGDYA